MYLTYYMHLAGIKRNCLQECTELQASKFTVKKFDRSRLGSSGAIVSRQIQRILNDSRRVLHHLVLQVDAKVLKERGVPEMSGLTYEIARCQNPGASRLNSPCIENIKLLELKCLKCFEVCTWELTSRPLEAVCCIKC
jgi:hypothetical protein